MATSGRSVVMLKFQYKQQLKLVERFDNHAGFFNALHTIALVADVVVRRLTST